jgi:putative DNA primase/helicase
MPYIDAKEVKRLAAGRWPDIIRRLAQNLAPLLPDAGKQPRHGRCPVHADSVDGFKFFKDYAETGGAVCNTCGKFPDGFKLIQWATGDDFKQVLNDVNEIIGGVDVQHTRAAPVVPAKPKVDPAVEDERIRNSLRSVYRQAFTLDQPQAEPARRYLASRGFTLFPETLRMHPALYWHDPDRKRFGPFPVLLAVVVDVNGKGVTLHRTYLTYDGTKAPVPKVKKVMARPSDTSMHGVAIRLFPQEPTLGVSEGIETAIACKEGTGIPCWPLVSAQFMDSFLPPPGVERVIVFSDKNKPTQQHPRGHGQEAATKLVENLWARGIKASIAIPPSPIPVDGKDIDWCDEYVRNGREAFKSVLTAA